MSKMFRTTDMILIAVMLGAAGVTFKLKHDAEDRLAHIRKLEAEIRFEEDTIDLLKADWALLTQPGRLQRLVEAFAEDLALQPVEPRQFASLGDLPVRPFEVDESSVAAIIESSEIDPILTGEAAQ